jgi:hypothetical protein
MINETDMMGKKIIATGVTNLIFIRRIYSDVETSGPYSFCNL